MYGAEYTSWALNIQRELREAHLIGPVMDFNDCPVRIAPQAQGVFSILPAIARAPAMKAHLAAIAAREQEIEDWGWRDNDAQAIIVLNLPCSHFRLVRHCKTAFAMWTQLQEYVDRRHYDIYGNAFSWNADFDLSLRFDSGTTIPATPSVECFTEVSSINITAAGPTNSIEAIADDETPTACDTVHCAEHDPENHSHPVLEGPGGVENRAEITINILVHVTEVSQTDNSPWVLLQKQPHVLPHGGQESNLPPPSLSPIHNFQPTLNPSPGSLISTPIFSKKVREFDRERWRWRKR